MPLGNGYFYDRIKRRYISIFEHAMDAVLRPDVFRCHKIKNLNPVNDRDAIVIYVLQRGFIRIRQWKYRLGWQFWGDPEDSRRILLRYMKKNGICGGSIITFTDFKSGKSFEISADDITKEDFLKKLKK